MKFYLSQLCIVKTMLSNYIIALGFDFKTKQVVCSRITECDKLSIGYYPSNTLDFQNYSFMESIYNNSYSELGYRLKYLMEYGIDDSLWDPTFGIFTWNANQSRLFINEIKS